MYTYNLIQFTTGLNQLAIQEIYNGQVTRYLDLSGNILNLPFSTESIVIESNYIPSINIDSPQIQNEEIPIEVKIHNEFLMYEKRRNDGLIALNKLMSELRLLSKMNGSPREVNKSIENAFDKVTKNIMIGWWITAKEECELVPVGGYVTQELWNRIYNTINSYISENY